MPISEPSPSGRIARDAAHRHDADTSACPGLSRIVEARDGGICRIRLLGGELTAAQAEQIAALSAAQGNSIIELTNRANLQLRGIAAAQRQYVVDALLDAGLGPHTVGGDDARNILISPSAGIDARAIVDVRPVALALSHAMQHHFDRYRDASGDTDTARTLSPKFSIQIDGGEALAMLAHHHDIWFTALPDSANATNTRPENVRFAFGIAGVVADAQYTARGTISAQVLPRFTLALIDTFLQWPLENDDVARAPRRMRDLLALVSVDDIIARTLARLALHDGGCAAIADIDHIPHRNHTQTHDVEHIAPWRDWRRDHSSEGRFGLHAQRRSSDIAAVGSHYLGVQAELGRLSPDALRALAKLATLHGDGTLRITPWQSVVIPHIAPEARHFPLEEVARTMRHHGLIVDADAPLADWVACAGSDGCAKAHSNTKTDARTLAMALSARMPSAIRPAVHFSGCERRCAAAHPMPVTLQASSPGRYDVYLAARGQHAAPLRHALDLDAIADVLSSTPLF